MTTEFLLFTIGINIGTSVVAVVLYCIFGRR